MEKYHLRKNITRTTIQNLLAMEQNAPTYRYPHHHWRGFVSNRHVLALSQESSVKSGSWKKDWWQNFPPWKQHPLHRSTLIGTDGGWARPWIEGRIIGGESKVDKTIQGAGIWAGRIGHNRNVEGGGRRTRLKVGRTWDKDSRGGSGKIYRDKVSGNGMRVNVWE